MEDKKEEEEGEEEKDKEVEEEEEKEDKEEEEVDEMEDTMDRWSLERLSNSCPQTDLQRCALEILAGVKRPTTVTNKRAINIQYHNFKPNVSSPYHRNLLSLLLTFRWRPTQVPTVG